MQYLIDTQIAVWIVNNDSKLSAKTVEILQNPKNEIIFSQISLIELSIKLKLQKLPSFITTIEYLYQQLLENELVFIPIQNVDIWAYQQIPFFEDHRDPFDRLLLATAYEKQIPIISDDDKFDYYSSVLTIIKN